MALGKSYVLVSGLKLTNSFVYSAKYTTRNFPKVGITIENRSVGDEGSGVEYTVRAYPVEGLPMVLSIASGSVLTSGSSKYLAFSNPYDQVDVGLSALQDNRSGIATVYVTGKRK